MATGQARSRSGYGLWMEQEGIPLIGGHGVEDLAAVPRGPWPRLGGHGAYLNFPGLEGMTGMYVVEVPGAGTLNPEKHLYEEIMYVVRGRGATEVWRDERRKHVFEWGEGSMFTLPLNTWHRVVNGSQEPAILTGVTNAPMLMDIFHNPDFVFSSEYRFGDRFDESPTYFSGEGKRYKAGRVTANVWETNFVPDVRTALLEQSDDGKVVGGHQNVLFEMADGVLSGHISHWPVGRYHLAHYHPAGAVLVILRSKGYTLLWPREAGTRPWESGHGDAVIKLDWKVGSAVSPPSDWFHQHFNTGPEPARQLAFHYSSLRYRLVFREGGPEKERQHVLSIKQGGTVIDYEDQDPEIHRLYLRGLEGEGVECTMPPPRVGAGV